jgi:dihydroxyacetone kinase-like protein
MSSSPESLNGADWQRLVIAAADSLADHVDELSQLDAAVGDGDHGVNVATAMAYARREVAALDDPLPSDVLSVVARGFLDEMGGAAGALFGSFFRSAARSFADAAEINSSQLADAIDAGTEVVKRRGKAEPGDKTMVDALAAATAAGRGAADEAIPIGDALNAIATAARQGAESTKAMTASRGRARYAEEKSIGIQDAGATTVALVCEAWASATKEGTSQ